MGQQGRAILGDQAEGIIDRLNQALAAEALDAYRYRFLSKWADGQDAPTLARVFEEMAEHEWRHMGEFMERIVQLGGTPLTSPDEFTRKAYAEYQAPPKDQGDLDAMVQGSLKGERAAISFYKDLAERTRDVDPVTWHMAVRALQDEVEDEDRLESFLGRR